MRSTPVEITENSAPLVMWRKEFRPDSGGAGQFRGGVGQIMEFAHADDEAFAVSKMFDRVRHPPRGRQAVNRVHRPGFTSKAARSYVAWGVRSFRPAIAWCWKRPEAGGVEIRLAGMRKPGRKICLTAWSRNASSRFIN